MKLLFIPSWNGHLYLQEESDVSVAEVFFKVNFENKELVKIIKNNIEETNKIISKKIKKELEENEEIISVTGDHSNSYPLMKEFVKKNPEGKIVIFDAHPDVEVSTESVSHEDYLRNLIENEGVNPKNVYLFGLRTFSRTEFEYLIEKGINFWTISDILKDIDGLREVLKSISGYIYLSLDIDVLDPDYAPGTHYTEWCGLSIEELIEFVKIIKDKVVCGDICEYYKPKDKDDVTLNNVLKLIDNFIS